MKLGTKKPAIKKLGFKKLNNLGGIRLNTFKPVQKTDSVSPFQVFIFSVSEA